MGVDWSVEGEGLVADGWELFGNKYGYGDGCRDSQNCDCHMPIGYDTVSGGGCVIIEKWVKI